MVSRRSLVKMKFTVALCILSLALQSQCKTFQLCELASELLKQGFPRHQLEHWICLVEGESSRRTKVIGGPNTDGSYDQGLFQINDRYWCNNSNEPGKECGVRCQDLRSDDITAASACAKKIYSVHGFSAWTAWVNKCQNNQLPNISNCIL